MRATAGHKTGSLFTRHRCQPVLRINCLDGGHPILKLWARQPTLTSTHNHRGKKITNHAVLEVLVAKANLMNCYWPPWIRQSYHSSCLSKNSMVPCYPASKLYTCFASKLTAFWTPAMSSMMLLPLTMPVVAIKKLRPDDKPDQCFSATCFHPSLACILSSHPT